MANLKKGSHRNTVYSTLNVKPNFVPFLSEMYYITHTLVKFNATIIVILYDEQSTHY